MKHKSPKTVVIKFKNRVIEVRSLPKGYVVDPVIQMMKRRIKELGIK